MAPSVAAGVRGRARALVEQRPRGLLGALDVGLVEGVDAEQAAGDGRRHLPQEQLGAQGAAHAYLRGGVAGRGVDSPSAATRRATVTSAAGHATSGSLVTADDDRQHAGAVLAGGLGDELLGPVGEADDAGAVVDEDELVAQRVGAAHGGAEAQAGVGVVVGGEHVGDGLGLVEQGLDVDSGETARHEAEGGQRGVAAADVRVGVDDAVALARATPRRAGCPGR